MIAGLNHRFADLTGATQPECKPWAPIVVPKSAIDQEIARLAGLPRPANGRRASSIVHPEAVAPGLGFAPGIDVTINVLKPGEETAPVRRNSNQVEICIGGTGAVHVGDQTPIAYEQFDVWNVPAMQTYRYRNTGHDLCVRLSYSNAPLLEKLGVHYVDEEPDDAKYVRKEEAAPGVQKRRYARDTAPEHVITTEGARLRGYEFLVDIEVVDSKAIHWPWKLVRPHLAVSDPKNRGIYLLYNPATERRNGTTHSFFATLAGRPLNAPENPVVGGHRHTSVAINYYFIGHGRSIVDGVTVPWCAGDLMLSAPGWSEHAHYFPPSEVGGATLTVQDHPLHIGMESLMWQEDATQPIIAVGSQAGIEGYVSARTRGN